MSYQFYFDGDEEREISFSCDCTGNDELDPDPTCTECGGTGKHTFIEDMHALSLAGGSTAFILHFAGQELDSPFYGEITNVTEFVGNLQEALYQMQLPTDVYRIIHTLVLASVARSHHKTLKWS